MMGLETPEDRMETLEKITRAELQGKSMEPLYRAGDCLIINLDFSYERIQPGDMLVLLKDDKSFIIHRYLGRTKAGNFVTQGDRDYSLDKPWRKNQLIGISLGKMTPNEGIVNTELQVYKAFMVWLQKKRFWKLRRILQFGFQYCHPFRKEKLESILRRLNHDRDERGSTKWVKENNGLFSRNLGQILVTYDPRSERVKLVTSPQAR